MTENFKSHPTGSRIKLGNQVRFAASLSDMGGKHAINMSDKFSDYSDQEMDLSPRKEFQKLNVSDKQTLHKRGVSGETMSNIAMENDMRSVNHPP